MTSAAGPPHFIRRAGFFSNHLGAQSFWKDGFERISEQMAAEIPGEIFAKWSRRPPYLNGFIRFSSKLDRNCL
jgi:hypothetical protein